MQEYALFPMNREKGRKKENKPVCRPKTKSLVVHGRKICRKAQCRIPALLSEKENGGKASLLNNE